MTLAYALAALGWVAGLMVPGWACWHERALPGVWRILPMALGVGTPGLLALGPHIEIAVVLIGAGWAVLGYRISRPEALMTG